MKKTDVQLGDVEVTALIPLMNRANETKRKNPRIRDEKAVEIADTLGIDIKEYDKLITHECVVARTIMFDDTVKELVKKYPTAVFVNLGCGLDNRFERVDNGSIVWFDIDLPDSIEVRKKVYEQTQRRKMIGADILDRKWIEPVKAAAENNILIAVAEGLLMYFDKEQNKAVIDLLTENFDKGFLIAELMNPVMMDEKKHDTVKHTKAKFGWGTKSGKEFELLNFQIRLISEHSFSEQLRKSTIISRVIGMISAKFNNRIAVFKW